MAIQARPYLVTAGVGVAVVLFMVFGVSRLSGLLSPPAAPELQVIRDSPDPPAVVPAPPRPVTAPGRLAISPPAVELMADIGRVSQGRIAIMNQGGEAVRINGLQLVGAAAVEASPDCPAELGPGRSCTVTLVFRPAVAGRASAALLVLNGSSDAAITVPVVALGNDPAPPPLAEVPDQAYLARLANSRPAIAGLHVQPGEAFGAGDIIVSRPRRSGAASPQRRPDRYDAEPFPSTQSSLPTDRRRILTAGSIIPAVLQLGINTQRPGWVVAKVERNVYADEGNAILLDAETRLLGAYQTLQAGDTRVVVTWREAIRPDGVRIRLNEIASDRAGLSGLPVEVDNRWFERIGAGLLVSFFSAGVAGATASLDRSGTTVYSAGPLGVTTSTVSETATGAAARAGGQELNRHLEGIAREVTRNTINLPPIGRAAQGERFLIVTSSDLVLRSPPEGGLVLEAPLAAAAR